MKFTCSSNEFESYMRGFQDSIDTCGRYERIPYPQWRELRLMDGKVEITYLPISDSIVIRHKDKTLTYSVEDSSFGEYLYSELFDGQEDVYMNSYGELVTSEDATKTFYSLADYMKDKEKEPTSKNIITNKKENKTMKGFNFDFGTCAGDNVRMSMYGLAVKNAAGTWVSYNPKDGNIIDVDVFNFDGSQYMFKMPVALKDVAAGDIIIHNRTPVFVTDVTESGKISAVDVRAGEEKFVIPTTNMFGFNFVTKIVSMFNAIGDAPTPDAPFGNMLPFLMMGDSEDIDPMMMFMMMQGSNKGTSDMFSNPMMMYFLMKDSDSNMDKMLPLMFMMNGNK